jgi:hypothetical protein
MAEAAVDQIKQMHLLDRAQVVRVVEAAVEMGLLPELLVLLIVAAVVAVLVTAAAQLVAQVDREL